MKTRKGRKQRVYRVSYVAEYTRNEQEERQVAASLQTAEFLAYDANGHVFAGFVDPWEVRHRRELKKRIKQVA